MITSIGFILVLLAWTYFRYYYDPFMAQSWGGTLFTWALIIGVVDLAFVVCKLALTYLP